MATEDGTKDVVDDGRTNDALSNPRKYKSFYGINSKKQFEEAWVNQRDWMLANFSHIAYYDEQAINQRLGAYGVSIIFYDDGSGGQALLATFLEVAVLAFRGTEPSERQDLFVDMKIWTKSFRGATLHTGFCDATESLWKLGIEESLNQAKASKVYATGHSLGAAIALISGMYYEFEAIVTFGEPRVGVNITEELKGNSVNHIRYVNGHDLVTKGISEGKNYHHHGEEKKLAISPPHFISTSDALDHSIINYAVRIKSI
ncbi:MAG: hypothetical protein GQ583_10500 [Methyloprofundus sp.]|nr:hypothetical protein [Methyloprofundus sp.]